MRSGLEPEYEMDLMRSERAKEIAEQVCRTRHGFGRYFAEATLAPPNQFANPEHVRAATQWLADYDRIYAKALARMTRRNPLAQAAD